MKKNVVLEAMNVSVVVKNKILVRNVSFTVQEGQILGVVGDNKSGKSSLAKVLCGSLPVSDGTVFVMNQNIEKYPELLHSVSLSLDPPVFFKNQTVRNNVKYLCSLSGTKPTKDKVNTALRKFGLEARAKSKMKYLSYYERKLVSLALAFINEPKIAILDEPFKGISEERQDKMREFIKQLKAQNITVIVTAKDYETIENLCSRYIFMENRKIVKILDGKECELAPDTITYAFVEVKYPHYVGKLLKKEFNFDIKLLDKKVLFVASENKLADVVEFLSTKKIEVKETGYLKTKTEQILANMTPFYTGG